MIKKATLTLLIILSVLPCFAQKNDEKKNSSFSGFDVKEAQKELIKALNKIRVENNVDTIEFNETLALASELQAEDMAENEKAELDNSSGKYKTTAKRVVAVGGTNKAEEIVLGTTIVKGKGTMTEKEFAESVFFKLRTGKKNQLIIKNPDFVYASPSVIVDETGKKAYVSIVFGSFNTFNTGANKKKELAVKYSGKTKKLKAPEDRSCNACKKFKDYDGLSEGLYIEEGKIFIRYDNLRALGKFIRKPGDGLAVDIIQRAQYDNPDYTIMDNNLISKGVLLKTVTKSKLYGKNRIEAEKKGNRVIKPTKLDVQLGILPPKITGEYELNLLIVQNGKLCKTIVKSNIEQGDQQSNTPLTMLLMPDSTAYLKPGFEPKSESTLLNFTIPFEKNKSDYKESDMLPFLNALQEPDFLIEGLYITAYSSIEGDATANATLQKKRADNIIKALSNMQKEGAVTNVKTSDSWNLFQLEAEGGKYDHLTQMSKEKAISEINSKGLTAELEPILSKERFAQIVMDVTYDIKGPKEEKFSISKFNQAVKKEDIRQALKIQYYIGKKVRNKKYSPDALRKLSIPNDPKYSGLLNNQVVLNYMKNNNTPDDSDYTEMKKLRALDPKNDYIAFNTMVCALKLDTSIGDTKTQEEMENKIDAFYKTSIPRKYIDAMNIEWQFKIIEIADTMEDGSAITQRCIDKIKSYFNMAESSWQNNLKLSYVFARFKDYKFAASLLAPFIKNENPNEQLLFAYISYCAKMPELYKSRTFVIALEKAEKLNHTKYCQLFGAPYITFQVFDNPFVKADYLKLCK